jgi:hypothetical protein
LTAQVIMSFLSVHLCVKPHMLQIKLPHYLLTNTISIFHFHWGRASGYQWPQVILGSFSIRLYSFTYSLLPSHYHEMSITPAGLAREGRRKRGRRGEGGKEGRREGGKTSD